MTVLVTGGAGYIGSHMVLDLLDRGETVVVLDDLSTGHRHVVPDQVKFADGDIADRDLVMRLVADNGIDAVIHFAGSIVVPESVADPLGYYHNNTCKTRTLIEACQAAGVKHFIFSSTAAVYGTASENPVGEDTALDPVSPYGASKMMSERMLRDAATAHGFSFAILRYFNVAGADPKGRTGQSSPRATHLIKIACRTALGYRPALDVFGTDYETADGTCIRDYIHVTDLVSAHWLALGHLRGGGQSRILNCGYGRGFSVLEVVEAVRLASGKNFTVNMAARRPGDPPVLIADATRIRDVLGWRPALDDLDKIVGDALAWEIKIAGG